jgi:molecular chaperone DnaJ
MDLYLALGVGRDASAGEIKRAYRRLARRYHPELNPGNEEAALRFRSIVEAYETLTDPERRRRYDTGAESAPAARGGQGAMVASFEFAGFDFSSGVAPHSPQASTFGDLFADVMRGAASAVQQRGADLHADVHISFDAAVRGTVAHITVTRVHGCEGCGGEGRVGTLPRPCPSCQGSGVLRGVRGRMVFSRPCERCDGSGEQRFVACPVCGGDAVTRRTDALAVKVPAGVGDGERLRLAGQGNVPAKPPGGGRGAPGDLYVTVHVAPHPRFRRDRDDVRIDVPVAIHEAAFGAWLDVPSPTGPCRVRIPPGTQSGREFRVRERGVPSARTGRPGDLVVVVRLVLPPLDDERSRALVRELGAAYPQNVRADLDVT